MNNDKVTDILNSILEHELAGVVKYTHYSLMIYGSNRIPIVKWLRDQANESLMHAQETGEHITSLGVHPSLRISGLLETHKHSTSDILKESLLHEREQVDRYRTLYKIVKDQSVMLEDFAREKICEEEKHISEVEKMLRTGVP